MTAEKKSIMLTNPLQISVEITEFSAQSTSAESNRASDLTLNPPLRLGVSTKNIPLWSTEDPVSLIQVIFLDDIFGVRIWIRQFLSDIFGFVDRQDRLLLPVGWPIE